MEKLLKAYSELEEIKNLAKEFKKKTGTIPRGIQNKLEKCKTQLRSLQS